MSDGVDIGLWLVVSKWLEKTHGGNRACQPEQLNAMIQHLAEVEQAYLKLPVVPTRGKARRA